MTVEHLETDKEEEYKAQKKKEYLESISKWRPTPEEQELFNDDVYWKQSAQKAIQDLDKKIGWNNIGNDKVPLKKNYPPQNASTDWSYDELGRRYEHLKQVTLTNIPKAWSGLEFSLAVKSTLNIKDNTLPFPGILLGPASGSKTFIVELFKGYRHTLYLDSFSPRSFVSHNTAVKKENLKEVDLLPKLRNKFFLVSELAPIFSAKDEDLLQVMGILTRVVDGQGYQNHTGAQGLRGYDENIMFSWIGASVEISPKVFKVLSTLGPKLYFFRLPREERDEEYYFKKKNDKFNKQKEAIKIALHEYLAYFDMNPEVEFESEDNELPKIALQEELDEESAYRIIIRVSKLLARLRAIVPTWETRDSQGSMYNFGLAKIEDPERAITQLTFLARGYALAQGRKYLTMNDIPLVIHTAFSTTTIERVTIFDLLIANGGSLTTSQICMALNTTHPTARKTMTELMAVGLVTIDQEDENHEFTIKLKQEFDWFLTAQFKDLKDSLFPKTDNDKTMHGGDFSFSGTNSNSINPKDWCMYDAPYPVQVQQLIKEKNKNYTSPPWRRDLSRIQNNEIEESSAVKPYSDYLVDEIPIWQIENRGMTSEEAEAYSNEVARLGKEREQ